MSRSPRPLSPVLMARLEALGAELQELPGWPSVRVDACLMFYDVLNALDLRPRSIYRLMGSAGTAYIVARLGDRFTAPTEEEAESARNPL